MDTDKPTKTPADYMVIAISPALIMVMVHSVCFFLVDVFYRGEALGGVRWVLFWFVLAVVLIARIGIEQGDGYAMAYGLALAGVTWVYLSFVQLNPVFGAILLGIVWFTAHKITCNCTLVDDDVDASGQGLLQSLRRLPRWFQKAGAREPEEETKTVPRASGGPISPLARVPVPVEKKANPSRSQVPGVWLLYFAVAALPIFGVGQTLLPAGDWAARHRGFVYLFLYLAAALGLLITTSFLGLRRYLRQRYLVMPANIAFGWIQYGVAGAAIVLCLALLLPRPGAGEAWGALRYHVDYELRKASEYAARFNPHGAGPGRSGDQPPTGGEPQSGQASGPGQKENPNARPNDHGQQQSGARSNQGTPAGSEGGQNSEQNAPGLPPAAGMLYPLVKALFYLAAAAVLAWLLYRYRAVLLAALRGLWTAIRNFIAALLGFFKPSVALPPAVAMEKSEVRPFRMFKNPFLTGGDQLWPPEELIVHSYNALQSWALESEALQGSPQTPREFCRQLAEEIPGAAEALEHLAFVYGHVAYGGSVPGNFNPGNLRLLWDYMSSPRLKPPEEAVVSAK